MDVIDHFTPDPDLEQETDLEARRSAIRSLIGSGMTHEEAERWCDAWEIEAAIAALPRDPDFWNAGAYWIALERARLAP